MYSHCIHKCTLSYPHYSNQHINLQSSYSPSFAITLLPTASNYPLTKRHFMSKSYNHQTIFCEGSSQCCASSLVRYYTVTKTHVTYYITVTITNDLLFYIICHQEFYNSFQSLICIPFLFLAEFPGDWGFWSCP